ncbi:MAG: hypothetical protein V4623_09455 [Pseudomonadota bacterium]
MRTGCAVHCIALCFISSFLCCDYANAAACETVGFEQVPVEQLDARLARYAALPTWQLIDDKKFKEKYLATIRSKNLPVWAKELDVAGSPGTPYANGKKIVLMYLGNKIHEGNKGLRIIFDPISSQISGKFTEEFLELITQNRTIYFGKTDKATRSLLDCEVN